MDCAKVFLLLLLGSCQSREAEPSLKKWLDEIPARKRGALTAMLKESVSKPIGQTAEITGRGFDAAEVFRGELFKVAAPIALSCMDEATDEGKAILVSVLYLKMALVPDPDAFVPVELRYLAMKRAGGFLDSRNLFLRLHTAHFLQMIAGFHRREPPPVPPVVTGECVVRKQRA